jgi:hypothetical protein
MMLVATEPRIRLTFDVPDRVRRALNIAASRTACTVGQVIQQLVEDALGEDLDIAGHAIAKGFKHVSRRKSKHQDNSE